MKYISRKLLMANLLISGCLSLQGAALPDGRLRVLSQEVAEVDGKLSLDIMFGLEGVSIGSCQAIVVSPVVEGVKEMECPPVIFAGKMNYLERERLAAFSPEKVEDADALDVIRYRKGKTANYRYRFSLPYDYAWMDSAKVYMYCFVTDCAGEIEGHSKDLLADEVKTGERLPAQRYSVVPAYSFSTPKAEAVKNREEKGEAFLDFQAGKSAILPDFKNNAAELQKIRDVISSIHGDSNINFQGIEIVGFASVDGNAAANKRLSLARANSLKDYLRSVYSFDTNKLKVSAEGEDWKGLERLISESAMADKEGLLDIVRRSVSDDRKEALLRAYKGGGAYRRIAGEMFPLLRRVQYAVNYSVRTFTVEEGRQLVLTRPALLSMNEMFLVANSYEKGSAEFGKVFDIAVRLFPDDPTARNNAAVIALQKGDVAAASEYLKGLEGAEAANNRGVMYLLEGKLREAEEALQNAMRQGSAEAKHNLEELKRKQADNELFDKLSHTVKND